MTFPPPLDDRKSSERLHYERIAALHEQEIRQKGMRSGPDSLPPFLQAPYRDFARMVRSRTERDALVVDVAAGTGVHSLAAGSDATILALDISLLSSAFEEVLVNYYGMFSFVGPLLARVLGDSRAAAMLDALDLRMQWTGVLAFKVVIVARRPRQTLVI